MENFALNHQVLSFIYVGTQPATWQWVLGVIAAKYCIYLFPAFLIYQFIAHKERRALVITTSIALVIVLGLSLLFGYMWPNNRPFVDGLVLNHIPHSADYSFPSDHAVFAATIAFCFLSQKPRWIGAVLLLLALFIGWGRIYMGIHYPLDILGALVLSAVVAYLCIKLLYARLKHLLPSNLC